MTNTYTQEELAQARRDGEVTSNGVAYISWLASIDGAGFALMREPHHTDTDIAKAIGDLRRNRDVVGRIGIRRPLPANTPDQIFAVHKHSPGEWCYNGDEGNDTSTAGHNVNTVEGIIAYIPDGPDAEHNGRLIAAAPKLKAALEGMLRICQGDSGTGESYWQTVPEYVAARKALSKARGEI